LLLNAVGVGHQPRVAGGEIDPRDAETPARDDDLRRAARASDLFAFKARFCDSALPRDLMPLPGARPGPDPTWLEPPR